MQHVAQYVIALIVFAVQVAALQDVIDVIVHHAAVQHIVTHAVIYVIVLHVDAILEHSLLVTTHAIIYAKIRNFNIIIFLDKFD